jgi:Carboxypeptidase regulatory-like domain
MPSAKRTAIACLLLSFALYGHAAAQRDRDDAPTSDLSFLVVKDDNGKPVRNAAVIMHPVNSHGKQGRGDLELKTDPDGRANFDGLPYGKIRVQVLASGFQTFGEDYDVARPKMAFTIKLKRPLGQYSIYDEHTKDSGGQPKQEPAPDQKPAQKPDTKTDKPN